MGLEEHSPKKAARKSVPVLKAFPFRDFLLQQSRDRRFGLVFGREGRFAAQVELAPPAKQQPFGELMLAAKLGRAFLAALDLAAQVELELPRKRARRFGGYDLLRSGSVPAGVDSTRWYGRKGSLQRLANSLYPTHEFGSYPSTFGMGC